MKTATARKPKVKHPTAAPAIFIQFPALKDGERWAGFVLNDDGRPSHHLILLPCEAESVTWSKAKTLAKKAGGELPTRQEQALLYANLKKEFQSAWYWSAEPHAELADYAWAQKFGHGGQDYWRKDYSRRARAVRRINI